MGEDDAVGAGVEFIRTMELASDEVKLQAGAWQLSPH
jgi:hypothetical protein